MNVCVIDVYVWVNVMAWAWHDGVSELLVAMRRTRTGQQPTWPVPITQ